MNIREIIDAWIIAYNPTQKQKELAELRGKICNDCTSRGVKIKIPFCGECGCPISKKIFTNSYNPCPLKKWGEVDKPYMKQEKTLL